MSTSTQHKVLLQAPRPGMESNSSELYKFLYELWARSGGENAHSGEDLAGLTVTAKQLNTLVGINTSTTVQIQIETKANSASLGTIASQDSNSVTISGGTITGTTIRDSAITIPTGGGSINVNGMLHVDLDEVGNVGSGEDTLITYEMPSSTLSATNQSIEIAAWGIVAANANNKRIKLKFGATEIIDTTAVAANSGSWYINAKVLRQDDTTQQAITTIISDNSLIVNSASFTTPSEDVDGPIDILCTGEGTNDDDIIQKGLHIKWLNT